jgi:hypothetical protein
MATRLYPTHTMPLYYLFGLDEVEPRSFNDALILVMLRWLLTALLATLIGSMLCLLDLILLEGARNNEGPAMAGQDEDDADKAAGEQPRWFLRRLRRRRKSMLRRAKQRPILRHTGQ